MMYLVLTALLALNVSVEVLNAFKTVNHSIEKSNLTLADKNNTTYKMFQDELADSKTAKAAGIWSPPAMKAKALSATLTVYLDSMKERLINASSPSEKDGKREYSEGNLDAATRIFDNDGQGKILYNRLIQYRRDLLNLLDPANYQGQGLSDLVLKELATTKAQFATRLPIDTRIPESEAGNALTGDSAHDWTLRYFHMTPTVAALTILSKFQSDIKNSESQVIDYLHKQIGEVKVVFNKFEPLVGTNATYLMPGEKLVVTAGVGAYSDAAQPKIYFNGQSQPVGPNGTAESTITVNSTGVEHVRIEYTNPDGSPGVINKDVPYTVGQPSGASIFLEKMNVLYVKEDNPVKISGGSVGRENVHVSFTNGDITHGQGDEYTVVPTTPGEGKIIVEAKGQKTYFDMRIKYLPNPTGFVGTNKGGIISSAEFKADGALIAHLDNSDFISPFVIVSYKLGAIGGNISQYQEAPNDGPRWTGAAAAIVSKSTPGTNIFFTEIRVKGKDGRVRELPPMVFNLK
ncbi:MAG TPA: GldM family protein [Puia sp.]|nr:GldM family protein [Puia sp.]